MTGKVSGFLSRTTTILYFLIVLAILLLIVISILGTMFGQAAPEILLKLGIEDVRITEPANSTFAVILAGLAIVLAFSIIIPKFLLEQVVVEQFSRIRGDLIESIRQETKIHTETTDAHISRMVGVLLYRQNKYVLEHEKYEEKDLKFVRSNVIWAVGWSLRSFKNYFRISKGSNVSGESVKADNYDDLIRQSIRIAEESKKILFEIVKAKVNGGDIHPAHDGMKQLCDLFEKNEFETKLEDLFFRTAKEAIDIEFMALHDEKSTSASPHMDTLSDEFFVATTPLTILMILLLLQLRKASKEDILTISARIYHRSNYAGNKAYKKLLETSIRHYFEWLFIKQFPIGKLEEYKRFLRS